MVSPEMFGLEAARAGVVELGLAGRVKPLTVLKQASLDFAEVRNVLTAEPECVSHACGSLLRRSFSKDRACKSNSRQHQSAANDCGRPSILSHLVLL
jgi:hypothetical protein